MAEGWIKLYRNLQDHWIWEDAEKLKWWLDILLLANHQDKKFLLGNELLELERGEHHTSEIKLSERWGVSRTTVRKFLKLLESDGMISYEKSKKGTTLKVCNYKDYQDFSEDKKTFKKHLKNIKRTDKEHIKNHTVYTNNNDKNDKNDKNDNNNNIEPTNVVDETKNYIDFFQNNFHLINSYEIEILNSFLEDGMKEELLKLAMEKAVENNVRNINYVKAILQKWLENNIKTVEDVQAADAEFKRQNHPQTKKGSFTNYDQRNYDFDDLEKKLLGWDK